MAESTPTDEELADQGLSREQYSALDGEGRKYVDDQIRDYRKLEKASQLINVIKTLSERSDDELGLLNKIILNQDPSLREFVVKVVNDYRATKPDQDITEFFNEHYANRIPGVGGPEFPTETTKPIIETALGIESKDDKAQSSPPEEAPQPPTKEPTPSEEIPPPTKTPPTKEAEIPPKPPRKAPPATKGKVMVQPEVDLGREDRASEIAILISQWEHRTPDRILKGERDVIEHIMKISDENKDKGITDADICLAGEHMVRDENHAVEFPLESLQEDHREELIKRALTYKGKREGGAVEPFTPR